MSIYLNNAASGWPRAEGVYEAVEQALRTPPFHPGRVTSSRCDAISQCRKGIADFLQIDDPSRIILTSNSTQALNIAILGLGLNNDTHVITTVTEHNSVLRPLHHLKKRFPQLKLTIVGLDSNGSLNEKEYANALEKNPFLVVINHASNVTGRINPVEKLFQKAKQAGAITLLDASQSFGLSPVSASSLHADLIAITGHKGIHGPAGTGALYVNPPLDLEQVFVGGTGIRSDLMFHPKDMPIRLEAGTPNIPGFAGMVAALHWFKKEGHAHATKANHFANQLRNELFTIPNITVFDGAPEIPRTPVVSFRIEGWDVEETGFILAESFGILCRSGLHCAPLIHQAIGSAPHGTVRLSPSGFNTEEEIQAAIAAVRKLAE